MARVLAAGAVVRDAAERILLVKRGHEPQTGRWTVPGGRVEPGETVAAAAAREVLEETGLTVTVHEELGQCELDGAPGVVYEVHDFAATVTGGEAVAGDDAADLGWFSREEMAGMPLTADLLEILTGYGVFG